jgi:hypothetical protein
LARNFRFYEKKRGHRRTGSRTLGSLGEAVFAGALLALGCGWLVVGIVTLIVPQWRVNHTFVPTRCTVLKAEPAAVKDKAGKTTGYRPEVKIQYEVHGETRQPTLRGAFDLHAYDNDLPAYGTERAARQALDPFIRGQQCECWYDPLRPDVVVLARGYSYSSWLIFMVPLSLLTLGVAGLVFAVTHWGKSAEHRAAIGRRARPAELFEAVAPQPRTLPAVPDGSDITSSPGTKLAYRLPMSSSPAWILFGLAVAALLWNGALGYFVVMSARSLVLLARNPLKWEPDSLLLILFTAPFALVGAALAVLFVRYLLVTTGIGPTLVEVSDHPLLAGREYELFVSQAGRLKIRAIEVSLICEEEATYCQGTNPRTEVRTVYRQPIFRQENLAVEKKLPLEGRWSFRVPEGSMHSFRAVHNQITWRILIEGRVEPDRPYRRAFPLIVSPLAERRKT